MQREFPETPLMGVGAIIVDQQARVLFARRGHEPMKGRWSIPGGLVELGETLADAVRREAREETNLGIEPIELVELLDRVYREEGRVRYHYVIADYLCRITGGQAQAGDDATELHWAERSEWTAPSALNLDPLAARVVEKAWQRAQQLTGA